MGRPKGSKNKTSSDVVKVLDLQRHIEGTPLQKPTAMNYGGPHPSMVNWGARNNYPELLLDLYAQSPTHSSAIKFGVQAIVGNGIDYDSMQIDGSQIVPNASYSWDEMLRYISLDYLLFNSFAIEVIKNRDGKSFSFYHMPLHKVRCSEFNSDGEIEGYYVSSDWTEVSKNPPMWIDSLTSVGNNIEAGKPYLFVYKTYDPTSVYYPTPRYSSAIRAIQSEIEHILYDEKTISNGFVPSGMLVLNDMETSEEKEAVVREINKMFTGADNGNSLMVTFRSNPDQPMPEFIPFSTNTANVNLYEAADIRTRVRILSAHQIPDPALCGLPSIGATGFASEADKLEIGLKVYMKMVGNSNKKNILDVLNYMFSANGIDVEIVLKPFSYELETEQTTETEDNAD